MTIPAGVLRAWELERADLEPITMGNINRTFRVGSKYILQRLNPIFGAEVHHDIEAVTAHLESHGLLTPRLVRTTRDELWTTDDEGGVWRLQTRIAGTILSESATAGHCREAARLLGAFHIALANLEHTFCNIRPGVHDTERHRAHLAEVMQTHTGHSAWAEVEPIGHAIQEGFEALSSARDLPPRIVHGDPKLNNVVFDPNGRALCFIDLDTFSHMTIPVELGDAFRSWCNVAGENQTDARFDIELFTAGIEGYASTAQALLTTTEIDAITPAVEIIALELAARFCADALEESYFGWNRERFPSASAHNLHRARGQLSMARAVAAQRAAMERAVRSALHR